MEYIYNNVKNTSKDYVSNTVTTEEPNKCVISEQIDDYSIKNILSGEICTIDTAKEYGIFGKNVYFNNLVESGENIDTLIDNKTSGSNYSLCSVDKNNAYQNCVLTTKNPWKTMNKTKEYCMLPLNITLPEELKFNEKTNLIEKPLKIPKFKSKGDFCQEKWYDWFSIPDYHFGNKYYLQESSNEYKCFKPCEIGTLPKIVNGKSDKCIIRDKFEYGYYSSTFYYLPVSLILLLGSTKDTLLKKHEEILTYTRNNFDNIITDYDIYTNIINDDKTKNNIYLDIKRDLRKYIEALFYIPFDETNVIPPSNSVQKLSNNILTKDRLKDAYHIAKTYYELSTSKEPEKLKQYIEWKKQLVDISGFGLNSSKFYKQLLILKKACNVCFDNKNSYSNKVILYTLNNNLEKNEKSYSAINFEISQSDIILAVSSNISENTSDVDTSILKEQEKLISEELSKTKNIDSKDVYNLRRNNTEPLKYEQDNVKKNDEVVNQRTQYIKIMIVLVFFIIILIFMTSILWMIFIFFWTPIATIINQIILSFCYVILYTSDMFRGKYDPSTFNEKILELQLKFVNNKIKYHNMHNI